MWLFIVGVKGVERDLASSVFHCPHCRIETPCTRRKVTRFFTLFFIPLIPLGSMGEIVRCDRCRTKFQPEVLRSFRSHENHQQPNWRCGSCGNINPDEYQACINCGTGHSV